MANTWTNQTVAFHPLLNKKNECLGFAVVSKKDKYFYPATVKYDILLKDAKNVIVFNGFKLRRIFKNFKYIKHNLESLYFQLNSEVKFQILEDIVKEECYTTDVKDVCYICRPDKARKCVVAACFMLEYYLENYKKANKDILKLDNSLLENFSNRESKILINQVDIRTDLSMLQKKKWDLEREIFKKVGYPVWTSHNIEDQTIIKALDEVKEYKDRIDYLGRYLNIPKVYLSFDTTATATGRILCRDYHNKIGLFAPDNKYKNLFYCKEGKIFISADYKRQEAFILATVSKDKQLLEDIQDEDFYRNLAEEILKEEDKQLGKTLFYAIIYGSTVSSLAESLDISEQKAQESILKIKKKYKSLNKWLVDFKEKTNYFGRPLYKKTVNAYIQSTAADLIRQKLLDTIKYNPVLVLADNIIYRVPEKDSIETLNSIRTELNRNPFNGLYTEPITSHTLKFE